MPPPTRDLQRTRARGLEPFAWHTCITSATEWENFYNFRTHLNAQPEIQITAELMKGAMVLSEPRALKLGEWHLPMIEVSDLHGRSLEDLVKIATGRCARVSYLTHDDKRDPSADIELHDRLAILGHMSPMEHCARVATEDDAMRFAVGGGFSPDELDFVGNFRWPFVQYRKLIPGEAVFRGPPE